MLSKTVFLDCLQNQVGLPWYISWLMYFVVEIIPPTQQPVSFCMVTAGLSMLLASIFGLTCAKHAHYNRQHSPVNSTPTSRSYSSLNLITASSAASTKSASLNA
jgi:hypothetical protein